MITSSSIGQESMAKLKSSGSKLMDDVTRDVSLQVNFFSSGLWRFKGFSLICFIGVSGYFLDNSVLPNHCSGDHKCSPKLWTSKFVKYTSLLLVSAARTQKGWVTLCEIIKEQISAKQGPDSRFVVEVNTKSQWSKLSRSWIVKLVDQGRVIRPRAEYWVE